VGSELNRGDMAGFDCGIEHIIDLLPFKLCIDDLIETNRQKATLTDPFQLWVYLAALDHVAVQKMPLNSDTSFPFWRDSAIKLLKKTKISIRDYCKAMELTKCDPAQIDNLSYGAYTAASAARAPNKPPSAAPASAPSREASPPAAAPATSK